MAIIVCVECGNSVSDKAQTCPKCGNPIQRQLAVQAELERINEYQRRVKTESLMFCMQCGRMGTQANDIRRDDERRCSYCDGFGAFLPLGNTPHTYSDILNKAQNDVEFIRDSSNPDEVNDWIVQRWLKKREGFNELYYRVRIQKEALEQDPESSVHKMEEIQKEQPSLPTCPNCHSTNIERMGALNRGASLLMFGIFSSKIGKTYQCHNCGYRW